MKNKILQELCAAFGPTGRESRVAGIVKTHFKGTNLEVTADALGNVIAHRGDGPYRVFCTHLDQPGWVVEHRDKKGFLHLRPLPSDTKLGPGWGVDEEARRYRIFIDPDTKTFRAENLVKDSGEMGTFIVPLAEFEFSQDAYFATALGDRVCAAAILEAAKNVHADQSFACVFYTGRYLNFAGVSAALETLKIQRLYLLEPLVCGKEKAGFSVGKGPGVLLRTQYSVAPSLWVDEVTSTASGLGIKLQKGFAWDEESAADTLSRKGIPSLVLGIPLRYRGSQIERAAVSDCKGMSKLLGGLVAREEDQ